jgi:phosphoribosylformimino-5-aminoimidazole carboxamide ribotide isomerase
MHEDRDDFRSTHQVSTAMEVWPAIDLRGGKCVRLRQGDYGQETIFSDSPADMARHWVSQGAKFLHLVDLDGARDGRLTNLEAIRSIVHAVDVPCRLGGGIREEETIRQLLNVGLAQLVIGTRALREPDWFRRMCHQYPNQLALGIDARDGMVATDGWLNVSSQPATVFARQFDDEPISAVIYTDIAKDGMMEGPNVPAMEQMVQSVVNLAVIASGGITTAGDVRELSRRGLHGCIIGRSLYEGQLSLSEALEAALRPL